MALLPLLLLIVGQSGQSDAALPTGVRAEWGLKTAWREVTPTRERVCLNGLWKWQPGGDSLPDGGWGWFKVPGCWPGISDYMQKDCQTVIAHPTWSATRLGSIASAWYQREFTVPAAWKGRRIALDASYVNSLATVYIDGKQAGTISFPAGEANLTNFVTPGGKYQLSIQVVALPLKAVMLSYSDTNAAKQMKATVERRGLCGDLYLVGTPSAERIDELTVRTSYQSGSITFAVKTAGLNPAKRYRLRAKVLDHGIVAKDLASEPFAGKSLVSFTSKWLPKKLWDIDTPSNQYDVELSLLSGSGKILDVQAPKRFGFRELWIDGRDFRLNGKRIFWSCVPVDNAAISAGLASYSGAKESFRRLKSIGINMVYTHNYSCNPGSNLAFDEILQAADDVGVLVALTQPHFGDYDWSAPDADANNGYARHAAFFAQVAGNHPSVVAYSTSHNATGYNEDTDPDQIDGIHQARDGWSLNNMKKAIRAQAIIEKLDPSRIVYHHSSGNLGTMHTMNFYLNFVPIQELDDWYEHWATTGVKPAFMVEYGVPFSWDWSMYRGWYKGERSFGNAQVPWEYTMAEWNAQFLGDSAYNVSEAEKRNIRWEAAKFKAGGGWFRWDYPYPMGSTSPDFELQQRVWAQYTTDNWRAFRTWGVSGISPWETFGLFWRLKDGVNRGRVDLKTDWDHLQRPGYSPDYVDGRYERRDVAYDEADWIPTTGGKSLLANNAPLLAYIGGRPGAFTDKEHNFRQGDRFEKQLIVVNNSREEASCRGDWWLSGRDGPALSSGLAFFRVPAGAINKVPMKFSLPATLSPGVYTLKTRVEFHGGQKQEDVFSVNVLPALPKLADLHGLGIYDPAGETLRLLTSLGVTGKAVHSQADLAGVDTLILGKDALTPDGAGIDLTGVRDGLKVVMFEQSSDVLEKRFGFRVEEYGLRNVFRRVSGHPVLAGLDEDLLHDWRGQATLYPPRGTFIKANEYNGAPSVIRTGILQPRVWRCGNRGSVASVLIEKPAVGDFTPILDGGYSLQYSPLMEYREGKGMVILCQMDVTGRTQSDPAALRLVVNLLNYVGAWRPHEQRSLVYTGEPAGMKHLKDAGFAPVDYRQVLSDGQVLVIGPGGSQAVQGDSNQLQHLIRQDGRIVMVGLDHRELLSLGIPTQTEEYIGSAVVPQGTESPFAGIGPADVFNRDPRPAPLLENGAVLGVSKNDLFIQFQLAPWSFDPGVLNTKRVFRHTSFALSRLLGNLGVHAKTPFLARFAAPVQTGEQRWLKGFYLDTPVLEDDPYRFFGW
jgi:hypothetical protein